MPLHGGLIDVLFEMFFSEGAQMNYVGIDVHRQYSLELRKFVKKIKGTWKMLSAPDVGRFELI